MCKFALLAIMIALSVHAASAREIRRDAMPEAFWGTWALGTDPCKENDTSAIVLSAKAYAGPAGNCAIAYVTEIPGRAGPIYSARLQCSRSDAQPRKKAIANLIIQPDGKEQISVGSTFDSLMARHRCSGGGQGAEK